MDEITVELIFTKRIYGDDEGDFSIYAAKAASSKDKRKLELNKFKNISVSGSFKIESHELERKTFEVTLEHDRKSPYRGSYKLVRIHYNFPENPKDQWAYLYNNEVMPVDFTYELSEIFDKKQDSVRIIDKIIEDPTILKKVDGIGDRYMELYYNRLIQDKGKAVIFSELGDIEGIGPQFIRKVFGWKPDVREAVRLIKENPFILITEEIAGFMTADKIRAKYNIPLNDTNRIIHGVKYYVTDSFENTGDTYADFQAGVEHAASKLGVTPNTVAKKLVEAHKEKTLSEVYGIHIVGPRITTVELFEAERAIYRELTKMKEDGRKIVPTEMWEENKKKYLESIETKLSPEQDEFLSAINDNRVTVLLGPGGSGKSWVTKIAVDLLKQAGASYGLFAPTARAAHVMQDYIGEEAQTIHRGLMQFAMSGMAAPYDVLIIDEFSMVDSELAHTVLKVLKNKGRLILIGDDFQLPSVGPGNVLFDIVNYVGVKTVKLTKIFRQDKGSGVLDYAHDLRNMRFQLPSHPYVDNNDIKFYNISDSEEQKEKALELYQKAHSHLDAQEIMLLSPVNRGPSGRRTLNNLVQEIVNPGKKDGSMVFGAAHDDIERTVYYKDGDYITITRNEYNMMDDYGEETEVINGDLGYITESNEEYIKMEVEGHSYTVPKSEIRELVDHAWSITIHKSQGGQADEVIIVLPYNSYFMLNANMLYTAITRAKKKCHVIGDFRRINQSAKKLANFNRKTLIEVQYQGLKRAREKSKEKLK